MEDKSEVILDYYLRPEFKYIDIPRSGKEKRRERKNKN